MVALATPPATGLSYLYLLARRARLHHLAGLAAAAVLVACGGSSGSEGTPAPAPAPAPVNQLVSATVAGYPHAVDLYATAGATRAIVLLHGGGGDKSAIAYQVGLNSDVGATTVNTIHWAWLSAQKVMLVVPQGQHLATEPNGTTWTNYVMNSGQNDKAFLQALAAQVRSRYGLNHLTLMGHSMGGVMTNRMWCESPTTFDAYASLAGPASAAFNEPATPCAPGSAARPYLGIIGDNDDIMRTQNAWDAVTWTVNPTVVIAAATAWDNHQVIAEFRQQQTRTTQMCGGTLAADAFTTAGNVDTWSSCSGMLLLKRVHGGEHGVASLDAQMGSPTGSGSGLNVMNAVMSFVNANAPAP